MSSIKYTVVIRFINLLSISNIIVKKAFISSVVLNIHLMKYINNRTP